MPSNRIHCRCAWIQPLMGWRLLYPHQLSNPWKELVCTSTTIPHAWALAWEGLWHPGSDGKQQSPDRKSRRWRNSLLGRKSRSRLKEIRGRLENERNSPSCPLNVAQRDDIMMIKIVCIDCGLDIPERQEKRQTRKNYHYCITILHCFSVLHGKRTMTMCYLRLERWHLLLTISIAPLNFVISDYLSILTRQSIATIRFFTILLILFKSGHTFAFRNTCHLLCLNIAKKSSHCQNPTRSQQWFPLQSGISFPPIPLEFGSIRYKHNKKFLYNYHYQPLFSMMMMTM